MAKIDPTGAPVSPLDPALANQVTQPASTRPIPSAELIHAGKTQEKKVVFSLTELRPNERLLTDLADALGLPSLTWSCVDRALWSVARHQIPQNIRHIRTPVLSRPSSNNIVALEEFGRILAEYLTIVLRGKE